MGKRTLLFILLLWAGVLPLAAQQDTAEFLAFIDKAQEELGVTGMSWAFIHKGEIEISGNYGVRSQEVNKQPDANTMYAIASLSKAFTVCGIGMLVDEGLLRWDDPVIKHLPQFALHDSSITQKITVEDILSHRSGLETFDGDLLWYGTTYSREEVVSRIQKRPMKYDLGEKFGYQNIMFITAGEIIEKVSGQSWDEFVAKRILIPLKMNRTTSDFESFLTDHNKALPHIDGSEIFMMSYNNSGATAALNSTVSDMAKWLDFWMRGGKTETGEQLLSRASIDRIWSSQIHLSTGAFDEENEITVKAYGLGWFLMDYKGAKILHHGGGLPGYISKVAIDPVNKNGVVVLTNDMTSAPTMLMYAALDWAEGREYKHWLDKFLDLKQSADEKATEEKAARLSLREEDPKILPIEDYLGTYRDDMYGEAKVSMGEDGLILSLIPSKELFTGKLQPWSEHAFRFDHNDPFLTYGVVNFEVKQDIVHGFWIDLPNHDFHFDKLRFEKSARP